MRTEAEENDGALDTILNACQIQNQHPWILLCTEYQLKQSTSKFREQICPNRYFGNGIYENNC